MLIVSVTLCITQPGLAQSVSVTKLSDQSVVKDSSGRVYTAKEWSQLLNTGKYNLRKENFDDSNSAFILFTLTEEEIRMRRQFASPPSESKFFSKGKGVAGFIAKDMAGNEYNLRELEGRVVVVNFWFIACGSCRREIPELNGLAEDYRDSSNVVFLAIALDKQEALQEFLKKEDYKYHIIPDGSYITKLYGVNIYPTHLVLDRSGKVVFHTSGYGVSTISSLRKSIADALK